MKDAEVENSSRQQSSRSLAGKILHSVISFVILFNFSGAFVALVGMGLGSPSPSEPKWLIILLALFAGVISFMCMGANIYGQYRLWFKGNDKGTALNWMYWPIAVPLGILMLIGSLIFIFEKVT